MRRKTVRVLPGLLAAALVLGACQDAGDSPTPMTEESMGEESMGEESMGEESMGEESMGEESMGEESDAP